MYSKLHILMLFCRLRMSKYGYAYRSSEKISQIGILLNYDWLLDLLGFGLLGFGLLDLFLLLIVLLVGNLGGDGGGASESALTLRDELVDSLSLQGGDDLVNLGISGVGLDATEEGFKILGG
jgi:hypothetical protein